MGWIGLLGYWVRLMFWVIDFNQTPDKADTDDLTSKWLLLSFVLTYDWGKANLDLQPRSPNLPRSIVRLS